MLKRDFLDYHVAEKEGKRFFLEDIDSADFIIVSPGINLKKAISYEWVEKGSNYLIKGFPNQKEYENAKDKVQEL